MDSIPGNPGSDQDAEGSAMSGEPTAIEWYIARDGAQHGPISDVEMHKFVELGHLRGTDLVWCARFTAWQPGAQAFPQYFQPKPVAPAPVAAPVIAPAPQLAPQVAARPASLRASLAATAPSAVPDPQDAAWADAMRAPSAQPAGGGLRVSAREALPSGVAAQAGRNDFEPDFSAAPGPDLAAATAYDQRNDLPPAGLDERPARRGWIGKATAAVAVLLIVGGLGWFGWQNRSLISGASAIGSMLSSSPSAPSADQLRLPPYSVQGETKDAIDASLQRIAVWRLLKREFADWYAERVADVEQMRAQKRDDRAITQFLVDVVVTLRRRNSLAALQSSPEKLRGMAGAFASNLKQLSARDGATCYAFITHGESSPFMVELSRTPAFAETLQKQMISVFEAIVDGRANRKIHPNTRRQDYDRLTSDLVARGWTQQDLTTFSDPQRLSQTNPDKVCTLVQEWFTTQLAIKDADLQTRLLAESLKPLVGG